MPGVIRDTFKMTSLTNLDIPIALSEMVALLLEDAGSQLEILGEISCRDSKGNSISSTSGLSSKLSNSSSILNTPISTTGRERFNLIQLLAKAGEEARGGEAIALARAVEAEKSRKNELKDATTREKSAISALKSAQTEAAEDTRNAEIARRERDAAISQLREAAGEISALTAAEQRYLKRVARARESGVRSKATIVERNLLNEISKIKAELMLEKRSHSAVLDYLSRQRNQLEQDIAAWMTRHEEDTERAISSLEALKQARSQDSDRFEELAARHDELSRMVDEDKARRAREQDERQAIRARERSERAARKIQVWWRSILKLKIKRRTTGSSSKPATATSKKSSAGTSKGKNSKKK